MQKRSYPQDKVIVIGCGVSGLAVIRALGRHNCYIIGLTFDDEDFAHVSKYVSEHARIPHPGREEKEFVSFLVNHAPRWKNALILETGDFGAVALSRNKMLLSQYYTIVTAEWNVIRQFIEKRESYALAESCSVPHPKTFSPQTLAELSRIKDEVNYPCILKPIYSHEFVNKFHVKNFKVHDEAQLVERFQLCLDEKQPVLIQEIILGPDTDIYRLEGYINSKGEMSAKFFHNKIRQNPPQFGVMRVGVSTRSNIEVEQLSERLLKRANYRGTLTLSSKKIQEMVN
jgi:predicted ATP-grasp superfamily ATP-dependent carboligase